MATALDVIRSALLKIGAVEAGEAPAAEDAADGLGALNDMLNRWEANGLSLGFSSMASTGTTVPVPDHALEAVKHNLAVRLASDYGTSVPAAIAFLADEGYRRLLRDAIGVKRSSVSHLPAIRDYYNIYSE